MFNLVKEKIKISCPKCDFLNYATFKQVKARNVIICRGCKVNVQLEDHLNSVRKSLRSMQKAFDELEETIKSFGKLTIKF